MKQEIRRVLPLTVELCFHPIVTCSTGPEYVFSVGDDTRQSNGVVTLNVGGIRLPNVLIDSGATSNLLGKSTWEWLKSQRIQCKT